MPRSLEPNSRIVFVLECDKDKSPQPSPTGKMATIGTGSTGYVVFTAAEAQLENIQQGERTGLLTDALTWTATKAASADTELTITFTDAV